ncbi:response regulator [Candidatus Albibeggiatoa sp. nov. NOAA]|uniref:response regulator n=1 Tax=Candidatus Albibeggiatoa sp. nov. NOAA TaxID=3162724 RepID=UPI003302C7A2|nr:response regulator [Thiotrichaceae bacterium]
MLRQTETTLLLIDDTPDNIKVLMHFLSNQGFRVLATKDGKSGLQKAKQAQPDLILLDIMMPEMDGFEVCQRLKADKATQDIPVIFITALENSQEKVKGLSLGAVDYITKPLNQEEVLARVNTHLKIDRLNKALQVEVQQRQQAQVALSELNDCLLEKTEQLRRRGEELEKRNMELDAFAHTVAHDLKNPLSGVIGLSEALCLTAKQGDNVTEKMLNRLKMIHQSGRNLSNIIQGLLLLAGVSRQQEIQFETVDMQKLVSQVLDNRLAYVIEQAQAKIDIQTELPTVWGYGTWIEEIWLNYISNAIKYGGHPPELKIGAETLPNARVRFWVKDNGHGMNPAEKARLFTPFTRLHQKRIEGHGLGLSIVKQIVEKLDGEAGVESKQGEGSLFYFILKRQAA